MPGHLTWAFLRAATLAAVMLLCVATAVCGQESAGKNGSLKPASGDSLSTVAGDSDAKATPSAPWREPREYTEEQPLIYEDAWDLWPYIFLDDKGKPTGYNVELMQLLFHELDIPYEIRLKATKDALSDLREGRADLMLGMKADYHDDYTHHYGKSVIQLFTHSTAHPKDSREFVHSFQDLGTQQVIVHDGSFSHHFMQDQGWEQNAQPFDDMALAIQIVSAENRGQVVWNTMSLKWLIHKYHADNITLSDIDMPSGEYRFMSHDSLLLARLDDAYSQLKASGRLQPLEKKWFYPEDSTSHESFAWLWYVAAVLAFAALLLLVTAIYYHLLERRTTADGRRRISRLAAVLKVCQVNIWTYDDTRKVISWYGDDARSERTMKQNVFLRRYWPSETDQLQEAIRRLLNRESEKETLHMHITDISNTDQTNRLYSVVLSVLKSEKGRPTVIIATEHDDTEVIGLKRKADELMLRYRSVFTSAMVDMIYCDSEGYVKNMNVRAQQTFQLSLDEAIRRRLNLSLFFPDEDLLTYQHVTHPLHPDGSPLMSDEPITSATRYYELQTVPVFDDERRPLGIYATGRDVTDTAHTYHRAHDGLIALKAARDELSEYVSNINYVLQVGGVRIITYSPDSHVLTIFHRMHEAQYELTQQRCIALTDDVSMPQVMRALRAMDRRTTAAVYAYVRTRLRVPLPGQEGKEGGWQHVCLQMQLFPTLDDEGRITLYEGVCRDVTEMKHTERLLLLETEKAQEVEQLKNKFLHNMCYAIRTPLDAVVKSAELFESDHDAADEPAAIETIKKHTAYLLNLVNDILFLSRLDAQMVEFNKQECDFTTMVEVFCQNGWSEGRQEGVEYVIEHMYNKLVVEIDTSNVGRIIEQVLRNAVAHTKRGRVRVRYEYIGMRLVIGIDDTGSGIPKDMLDHIFERFKTPSEKSNSTGLGLPICHELATQMGGSIDIASEVSQGTNVWVSIPCEAKSIVRK